MLRKYFLIITGALLIGQVGKGQLADKATFFGGFTYQIVSMTPQGQPNPWQNYFYGLSLGMNYVIAHSNDQVSLGVNPNFNFSFLFSNISGTSLLAQGPVFLLARFGAGATPYNEQKFGIGAGIGANYSYMLHRTFFTDPSGVQSLEVSQGFLNPSAVVEIGFKSRFSDYLFRFNWSLAKPTHELGLQKIPFRMGSAGLGILYTF